MYLVRGWRSCVNTVAHGRAVAVVAMQNDDGGGVMAMVEGGGYEHVRAIILLKTVRWLEMVVVVLMVPN